MVRSPSLVAESFPSVGLAELERTAALQDRIDVKYVVTLEQFAALAQQLLATHSVLEIDGRRAFAYRTTYFDTAELRAFRDHVQQRRRRYKCRSREYVDSGFCTFEVKLKGARGRTVKHRMPYDIAERDALSDPALTFLRECVNGTYGREPESDLEPALAVAFTRVTFAAPELGERVTCDFDLAFSAPDGTSGQLAPGAVIVESKSPRGNAAADRILRTLGARPADGCSKYALGVSFTRPGVRGNGLRPLLKRYFRAAPVAAVALALTAEAAAADVPKVSITAKQQIRDDPKVPAKLKVGKRTYRVGIELRGSSSQRFAKKPYAIETGDDVRLLGLPRADDWDLNAFHTDPALLRDVLAHGSARRIGLKASRTRFVELRVNRRYRGVYVLIEPPSGDGLLELTEPDKVDAGDDSFPSKSGLTVVHADGDDEKESRALFEAFEAAGGGLAAPPRRGVGRQLRAARRAVQEPGRVPLEHVLRARGRQAPPRPGLGLRPQRGQHDPAGHVGTRGLAARGPSGREPAARGPGVPGRAAGALAPAAGQRDPRDAARERRPQRARAARAGAAQLRPLGRARPPAVRQPARARLAHGRRDRAEGLAHAPGGVAGLSTGLRWSGLRFSPPP